MTPSHLIAGRRLLSSPQLIEDEEMSNQELESPETFTRRLLYLNKLLHHYWNRFSREYVVSLREFHKCHGQAKDVKAVSVGEVVHVYEDNTPRLQWKLGLVEAVNESADGEVRSVVVSVTNKAGKRYKLRRPIQNIYPLEITDNVDIKVATDVKCDICEKNIERPPRRMAAKNADSFRRDS